MSDEAVETVGIGELRQLLDALYDHANDIDPGISQIKSLSLQEPIRKRELARQRHGHAYGLRDAVIEIRKWLD